MEDDVVVDMRLNEIFRGTPEKVQAWIAEHPELVENSHRYVIIVGKSKRMMTVELYLVDTVRTVSG